MTYEYNGVISQQMPESPAIVLFSAPAVEIAEWAGIPQRRRIDHGVGVETSGFQREEKPSRVNELSRFMQDHRNVIQNPLLTATQDADSVKIVQRQDERCTIQISKVDLKSISLVDLFERAKQNLLERMPELANRTIPPKLITELREHFSHYLPDPSPDTADDDDTDEVSSEAEEDIDGPEDDPAVGLFQEETQVVDFYDELNARLYLLQELGDRADGITEVAGFNRSYVESLATPVVLVDGQHRLRGALAAVDAYVDSNAGRKELATLIDEGLSPDQASELLRSRSSRSLPVSLLATADPSEHVFQFVVVNQKATPMTNALLGTIVSTSLSRDELEPIAERLSDAGIRLESSRAVAYLSRSSESPFRGLVATGVRGDQSGALPWSVLVTLANMVRELDGRAFHPPKINQIKIWRTKNFSATGLIPADISDDKRFEYWKNADGPWRELFLRLHTAIRDKFGDTSDMKAYNAWGVTTSNLYNMVSLSILTVDYFAFLRETNNSLADWDEVDESINAWIGDLNPQYFNRDWRMFKTKKDQSAIKEAWSAAWFGYRSEREKLPRVEVYNPAGRAKSI